MKFLILLFVFATSAFAGSNVVVPIYQCVIEVPKGTYARITSVTEEQTPRVVNVAPFPAALARGEDATILGAKTAALQACADLATATSYAGFSNSLIYTAGQDLVGRSLSALGVADAGVEGCKDLVKRSPHLFRCQQGLKADCAK